ncbi:MAG: UDP-N-acetylmuramate dehydrogenase [Candidatus Pacebacteria bacterium]|nr:UDP-N-acetylmuramate dehydrogenase [Candidatus Paceibacterota bacterium]
MTNNQRLVKAKFPDLDWSFNYPLAESSYFKLGGLAEIYYKVKDQLLLKKILVFCEQERIPWKIVGGLSNLVIADAGVSGLVLQIAVRDFQVLSDQEDAVVFRAATGIKTSQLVSKAVNLGGTGLEGFIGVPGTLGGAIYNNAHYLKALIGDYVESVVAFHVKHNKEIIFSREMCKFAYEHSVFQEDPQLVILAATFSLRKDQPDVIKEKLLQAQEHRQQTQPLHLPSSGCIFRNPPNTDELRQLFPQFAQREFIPAGFLIDQAGLKNQQVGAIVVSDKHAAFLVNMSEELQLPAKAQDVKKLIAQIQLAVKKQFKVELKEEIFYLGQD